MASKAFLSYEFNSTSGKFVIQSRKTTSDTVADLADASFYVAWVDFAAPLAPPDGPRMRSSDPVLVAAGTGDETSTISPRNGNLAANTDEPELLVVVVIIAIASSVATKRMRASLWTASFAAC